MFVAVLILFAILHVQAALVILLRNTAVKGFWESECSEVIV